MIGLGCGLLRLESTVKLQHRFAPGSRIIQDYAWMERHLGPLVPLEVVIHFGAENPLDFFGRMEFVADLEEKIRRFEYVEATMSAADFAPVFPRRGSTEYLVKRPVAARTGRPRKDLSRALRGDAEPKETRLAGLLLQPVPLRRGTEKPRLTRISLQ